MVLRMLDEHYVIGICTKGTRPTLDLFLEKFGPILREHEESVRIVIVVNGGGELVLADHPNVSVVREPRLGIAFARNRVLQEIGPNENLIFIDDDEYPDQDWFANLMGTHAQYPNAMIVGQVLEVNADGVVVENSKIRPLRKISEGTSLKMAPTNNLLIPAEILKSRLMYFDLFFNYGGSDSDLTFRLTRANYKIRWSPNAIMYEIEDEERNNPEWAYKRNCRNSALYPLVISRNSSIQYVFLYFIKKTLQVCSFFCLQMFGNRFKKQYFLYKLSIRSLLRGDSGLYDE